MSAHRYARACSHSDRVFPILLNIPKLLMGTHPNIGGRFEEIYQGVTGFADAGKPVHLRNEEQLRYGVSTALWGNGVSIAEWVKSLKTSL